MQRQILKEQLDNNIRKGFVTLWHLYKKVMSDTITDDERDAVVNLVNGLYVLIPALLDIQKGNDGEYVDAMWKLAEIDRESL